MGCPTQACLASTVESKLTIKILVLCSSTKIKLSLSHRYWLHAVVNNKLSKPWQHWEKLLFQYKSSHNGFHKVSVYGEITRQQVVKACGHAESNTPDAWWIIADQMSKVSSVALVARHSDDQMCSCVAHFITRQLCINELSNMLDIVTSLLSIYYCLQTVYNYAYGREICRLLVGDKVKYVFFLSNLFKVSCAGLAIINY